ncbi:MAG: hypothetical protein M3619_07120 [Myxococcota bacterium]|nr:hypothetical protein [Myxococcota bacterium]
MGTHPLEQKADDKDSKQSSKSEPVESKKIPVYKHERPHKLDSTVSMAVLLRRIYEKTHIDANLKGDVRQAKVIFAADDATELTKELLLVASFKEKENWSEVRNELAHALRGIQELEAEARGPEKARLTKALKDLENVVDPNVFAAAKKAIPKEDKLPALDESERIEMAAQAIIAACRQAALFDAMKPGDDMAQARQLMRQMRLHYDTATDALSSIEDKRKFKALNKDVELATKGMDSAQQFMKSSKDKKLPWDRAFAEGFDAEARFLDVMGLKELKKPRPYSGTIDPDMAIQEIDAIAASKGADHKWSEEKFESPQQAVAGIGVAMNEIFSRQSQAVKNAASDLKEPRLPKEQSMLDTLLDILIKTALAGAAGAIGSKISSVVSSKLNKALTTKAANTSMFSATPQGRGGGDYFQARDTIAKDALGSGAAATTMKAEFAKDAFKEFFKQSGYKAIMSAIGSGKFKSNSTNVLSMFSQHSENVLGNAQFEGKMAFVHLAPALGQAEPGALWELYQSLLGQLDDAYTIQYSYAMEEWQNFKARMHHGLADDYSPKDNTAYHERDVQPGKAENKKAGKARPKDDRRGTSDAKVGRDNQEEKGALLIEGWLNTDDFIGNVDGKPHVTSLRLPDAEDATLKHFREENDPLSEVHLNQHYKLKFVMYMTEHTVDVGVGADHGLLESTLGAKDQAILRVVAAGERVTNANTIVAAKGTDPKYSRFSVADLEAQMKKYIKVIQRSTRMGQLKR